MRNPPPHRRKRDPFRKAQRAPQIRQPGLSPMREEMQQPRNVHPLPEGVVLPKRPVEGKTRQQDGRWEVWVSDPAPGGWVCAEPVDNAPEGMCGMPVEDVPCPIHHPQEEQ